MHGASPEEAKFYWTGGPLEVAPRTWFASLFSGVVAFETDAGMVLVDTGLKRLSPSLAALLRGKTQIAVHTVIYTHGHVDHAHGLEPFLLPGQTPPRVIGHKNMPARFERYRKTAEHNSALNARQFGGSVDDVVRDDALETFSQPPPTPDTLYDDRLEIEVGGVAFELHHCRGETDDHTWVFCPDRGVLCPGDLFIWSVPNAGNPQKVQRYPWDWAAGLRKMARCQPRTLCPGHGGPIINDPDLIGRMLVETADYLDALVEQTLTLLKRSSPPHVDIVRAVEPPATDAPWLQPVYDEAEFIVRNIIRYYGGWYSGRPSELKPAPRAAVAFELAALVGSAQALAERAQALAGSGQLQLACHLADLALEAAPTNLAVQEVVAELYEQRAAAETSLMAINLFRSAAAYARQGRPFS